MADINGYRKTTEIAQTLSTETSAMTLLSNGTLYKSNEMLRNSAEDVRILSTTEMRGRQLHPLILSTFRQLPVFHFEMKLKQKQIRPKQTRPNVAEHRAAPWISISILRRRKLQQFDYETHRADFAKGYVSTTSSADALASSTYNTLMMTWKKPRETSLQTFPT